ncbi:MAG TPA: MBL fold metallo-hydrolase [Clostridia bacterium]
MDIRWNGHSCFSITSSEGTKIVTDPYDNSTGYTMPEIEANILTSSHNHFDHNNIGAVKGDFNLFRTVGEFNSLGINIKGTLTYHDTNKGADRGQNIVYTYNVNGINVCHLGDLGHTLDRETIKSIGKVDVLLIPVGGVYTIDAKNAAVVVKQLNPKIVIPMHYKTPVLASDFGDLTDENEFISKMPGWKVAKGVSELKVSKCYIDNLREKKLVVLKY